MRGSKRIREGEPVFDEYIKLLVGLLRQFGILYPIFSSSGKIMSFLRPLTRYVGDVSGDVTGPRRGHDPLARL